LDIGPFENIISDFYLTNPIARSSEVMAELSSIAKSKDMKVAAE
jgi:NADH-quinone oxidoreductase subunit G